MGGTKSIMDETVKETIDSMNRTQMARHWRFDPPGSNYFQGDIFDYFMERFMSLGGFSPEISKQTDRERIL